MNQEREMGAVTSEKRRYYNPIQKDYATFLETSEETGGEFTLIEIEVAPGGGTPPHYHKRPTTSISRFWMARSRCC